MQDDELRAIQIADPLRLKRLHLTPLQYGVIKWVIERKLTPSKSTDLVSHLGVTIRTASGLLLGLHNTGYLNRKEVVQRTGGLEYEYTIKPAILRSYHEALNL